MLQKLQNDNDDLMEIFQQHYAELPARAFRIQGHCAQA